MPTGHCQFLGAGYDEQNMGETEKPLWMRSSSNSTNYFADRWFYGVKKGGHILVDAVDRLVARLLDKEWQNHG